VFARTFLVYNNSRKIHVYPLQNDSLSATETQAITLLLATITRKAFQMIRSTSYLLQLQLLKLPNSLLKASLLRLRVRKSALLHILYLYGDLLLISGIIEDLALLVDASLRLLEIFWRLWSSRRRYRRSRQGGVRRRRG
jgi:hypothetical protein